MGYSISKNSDKDLQSSAVSPHAEGRIKRSVNINKKEERDGAACPFSYMSLPNSGASPSPSTRPPVGAWDWTAQDLSKRDAGARCIQQASRHSRSHGLVRSQDPLSLAFSDEALYKYFSSLVSHKAVYLFISVSVCFIVSIFLLSSTCVHPLLHHISNLSLLYLALLCILYSIISLTCHSFI